MKNWKKPQTLIYLLTDQNSIHDEIVCRHNLGNSCCYSVQKLFYPLLLFKNLKIKILETIILPVVLYNNEA